MIKKLNLINLFKLQGKERQAIFGIVVALFLFVNFLISGVSLRSDFSFGKAYTLSNSTRKILHELDDIVNINFFASSDLPTRLIPLKTDVVDTLSEYQKESKSKIRLKVLDPKKDENALKKAREEGVPELQFSQLEQDKYAVTTSYFGIGLSYGGKQEVIPQVSDFENLEYNLTASIYKLVRKELPKIGIIGEVESSNPNQDNLANLKKVLGQQFSFESVDLKSGIDSTFKTLIVFDSNLKKYSKEDIKKIRDYLEKNGKAIFFVDGVWVSDNLTTSEANHNLFSLLQDYGIKVEKNLVLSSSAELVNFGSGQVSLLLPYPFWFKTNSFDSKSSYFSNVNQLTFPWSSSLTLVKKGNIETQELIRTSKKSWEQKDNFVLNPQSITPPDEKELKEFLVVVESSKENKGQIVVIPSSRFVLDRYLGGGSSNLEFVLNVLNNTASDGALSGIRSRAVSFYPLPDLPENQKEAFKYLNILFLPILFSLWGAVRLIKRR